MSQMPSRDSLKAELDRMERLKVIRKLDIDETSNWVHALVLVVKPNGKLCVCLDPITLSSVLHNNHNAQRLSLLKSGALNIAVTLTPILDSGPFHWMPSASYL